MGTKKAIRAISLLVFCLLVFSSLPGMDFTNSVPAYVTHGNIFSDFFKEPVEVLVFIAITGDSYAITNYAESFVSVNYDELKNLLRENGHQIKDMMCVIHNHTGTLMKFSPRDLRFYNILRADGFRGLFLLWSSLRQRVVDMRYSGD